MPDDFAKQLSSIYAYDLKSILQDKLSDEQLQLQTALRAQAAALMSSQADAALKATQIQAGQYNSAAAQAPPRAYSGLTKAQTTQWSGREVLEDIVPWVNIGAGHDGNDRIVVSLINEQVALTVEEAYALVDRLLAKITRMQDGQDGD